MLGNYGKKSVSFHTAIVPNIRNFMFTNKLVSRFFYSL